MDDNRPLSLDEARQLARAVLRAFPWRDDQQAAGAPL